VFLQSGYINAGEGGRVDGSITCLNATTDTSIDVYIENDDGVQIESLVSTTYSFVANTPVTLATINGDVISFTAPTTAGEYYIRLYIGDETLEDRFTVIASTSPVISDAALSDSAITEAESTIVSCDITNMSTGDVVLAVYNSLPYLMTTTDYTTYTTTLYGHNVGISSGTVQIIAENGTGCDDDTSLSLTVTTGVVEAVTFIESLLDDNWNATNVAKPTIVVGGTARSKHRISSGDFIKIYRAPRPTIREPRFRRNYEYRDEYVQIMALTTNLTPRAQLELLKNEILRIINSSAAAPGSGWDKMWVDVVEVRKEFSEEFSAVFDISLTKIITAVNV
jgi:hypothetical protein